MLFKKMVCLSVLFVAPVVSMEVENNQNATADWQQVPESGICLGGSGPGVDRLPENFPGRSLPYFRDTLGAGRPFIRDPGGGRVGNHGQVEQIDSQRLISCKNVCGVGNMRPEGPAKSNLINFCLKKDLSCYIVDPISQ